MKAIGTANISIRLFGPLPRRHLVVRVLLSPNLPASHVDLLGVFLTLPIRSGIPCCADKCATAVELDAAFAQHLVGDVRRIGAEEDETLSGREGDGGSVLFLGGYGCGRWKGNRVVEPVDMSLGGGDWLRELLDFVLSPLLGVLALLLTALVLFIGILLLVLIDLIATAEALIIVVVVASC